MDTPRDLLRDAFASYKGHLPSSLEEFRLVAFGLIDTAISSAQPEDLDGSNGPALVAVVELLTLMTRDRDPRQRMQAYCYLRLMGMEGRSFQEIGDELGVKRATVHKCYRIIQARTGLPGRGDKSDDAREKFRQIRLGTRRLRLPWPGMTIWKRLVSPIPLALSAA